MDANNLETKKKVSPKLIGGIIGGVVLAAIVVFVIVWTFVLNHTKLNNDKVTLEAGENFVFTPSDYFENLPEDYSDEDFSVNTDNLKNTIPGEYEVIVTYNGKDYSIYVTVVDTIAPVLSLNEKSIRSNDLSTFNFADFVACNDATECTYTIDKFEKLSDPVVLGEDTLTPYTDEIGISNTAALLEKEDTGIPTEDGIYSAVITSTDLGGNVGATDVIVVLDCSAPYPVNGTDEEAYVVTVRQKDIDAAPEVDPSLYPMTDDFDGDVTANSEYTLAESANENHEWVVKVSTKDSLGNAYEAEYIIKVEQLVETSSNSGYNYSGGSGSNSESNSESNSSSSGEIPQYTYSETGKRFINNAWLYANYGQKNGVWTGDTVNGNYIIKWFEPYDEDSDYISILHDYVMRTYENPAVCSGIKWVGWGGGAYHSPDGLMYVGIMYVKFNDENFVPPIFSL